MSIRILGMTFKNPVLPAAGPSGRDGNALLAAARGGAGGLVAKTVSVAPASPPHPNIAAHASGGLLNAELWSESPVERFLETEYALAKNSGLPLIASIGYTARDLAELGPRIEASGSVDAIEFSTHYLGPDPGPAVEAARALRKSVSLPILAKISPAAPDPAGLARALEPLVDGLVAVNSLGPVLDFDIETLRSPLASRDGCGWISGPPLKPLALRIVRDMARVFRKPIIGVGGISDGRDALQFMMAGASAVQVCTAAIRKGQAVYGRIAAEMEEWLDGRGFSSARDVVGLFLKQGAPAAEAGARSIRVDHDACVFCKTCVTSCIHEALGESGETIIPLGDKCARCGLCVTICPSSALSFGEEP